MEYKQYLTIDEFYERPYNDPDKFDTKGPATEYKWKGKMNHLSPIVVQKLKCFVKWMTHEDRPYELHDDFLATLTRESYLKFRHMDTLSFLTSSPSHHEPYKHQVKKSPQRKAFFPQQEETSDDDEYVNAEEQFSTDPEPEEHSPYSVYQPSSQDEPTEESPHGTSTQTLVNTGLTESGIDPDRKIQTHQRYVFARVNQTNHQLIDRGTNGGLAGADMRVLHTTPRKINIIGIDDHEMTGLNVVTAATLLDTQTGPIIGVFHEYAHLGKGRSIHAAGQMEWFNCKVDDRSQHVGGAQNIQTSEGYVIPLSIESGLVYMHSIRIPTDHDLQNYPHVLFTSPDIWDTSVLDHGVPPSLPAAITPHSADSLPPDSNFDAYGEPHHRDTHTLNSSFCALPSLPPGEPLPHVQPHETKPSPNFRLDPPQGKDQPHDLTSDVFVYGRPNLDEFGSDLLGSTFLLNGERDQLDVTDHKGPYTSPDTTYNGSSYNLLIEWEPGEYVLETSSTPTTLVERDKLDLSSLIPPKWTCPFKSPTSSTLCFGEPRLGKLNQETDFYMTKHMQKPSSGANRVSVRHSSLVTKNGEHFYEENIIHDFPRSWKHIKEDDWGDKLKLNYTTYGYMLMEIDWGGKFIYTSCGYPMANWQGHETHPTGHKTSEVDWGGHDPDPNHVNESLLSEVDWGAHNPDADDLELLTGESTQSFLTFVVQLQWLVALGRLSLHKSLPCPRLW